VFAQKDIFAGQRGVMRMDGANVVSLKRSTITLPKAGEVS
jgi:hypothetical protein